MMLPAIKTMPPAAMLRQPRIVLIQKTAEKTSHIIFPMCTSLLQIKIYIPANLYEASFIQFSSISYTNTSCISSL